MQIFSKTRFKQAYQIAMSQQVPRMYRQLNADGALQQHLQETAESARLMYDETVEHLKSSQGMSEGQAEMTAAEIVFAEMIQFPDETESTESSLTEQLFGKKF